MLTRPLFPKEKNVCVIVDVPVKIELENEEPFSSASNLNLLTTLRTGRVNVWNKQPIENFTGIKATDIFSTYLDYDYYGQDTVESNFDFAQEFRKRKDLVDTEEGLFFDTTKFIAVPHQKDLYVSERLWNQFSSLLEEIRTVKPKLIILTGKWSLFFLTGQTTYAQTAGNAKDKKPLGGLTKFRSSVMKIHECFGAFEHNPIIVPVYHVINAVTMPDKVPVIEIDYQKLAYRYHTILEHGTKYFTEPEKEYILGTTKEIVLSTLREYKEALDLGPKLLSCDIECFYLSVIDCIGITLSKDSGICIPFCTVNNPHYWSLEDEQEIMCALYEVMMHPNALHVGQNYQFDCQFFHFNWGLQIKGHHDTMVLHHILFNYLPKDLAFLASVYCEFFIYWKDDLVASAENPQERWIYNIKDIQFTLEVLEHLLNLLEFEGGKLRDLYYFQQQRLQPVLVSMMERGVRINVDEKEKLYKFFSQLMEDIEKKVNEVLGFEFNQNSTPQKKKIFSDFLGMALKKSKKSGNETCDASAMLSYIEEYPEYRPFLTLLLEYASLKVFTRNFLGMALDNDGRARTQYRIAGTATGRLASTKNVRGKGGNLMNIPEKGKLDLRYAVEVMDDSEEDQTVFDDLVVEGNIVLPNIKQIFLPDPGKELMDADLSGADIQIVAWDSECKWLMDYFNNPKGNGKVYHYIASNFFQKEISDKEYKTYKAVFHGTNYGMGINKLASMARIPEYLAKDLQDYYFRLNPEVKHWQERIQKDIAKKGYISNIFGRRAWFLNKNDVTLLNKAYAFIPQSSIADVMNRALVTISETLPEVDILLQVHDSGVFQYDISNAVATRQKIKKAMEVEIPYTPKLIIPSDFKVSIVSYGDTKKIKEVA